MYVFPLEVFCTLFVTLTGYQYKATHTDFAFNGTGIKSLGAITAAPSSGEGMWQGM